MDNNEIKTLIEQYEAIRRSGLTNMVQSQVVQTIASDNDMPELVDFIEEGRYMELISNYTEWIKLADDNNITTVEE